MSRYELVIDPITLYKLLNAQSAIYDEEIEDFRVELRRGVVLIQGHIRRGQAFGDRVLNLKSYVFSLKLTQKEYDPTQQIIKFEVQNFQGKDRDSSLFNMLGSFDAIANFIKRETIRKICNPKTPYTHDKDFNHFYIDLKYYQGAIPKLLGKLKFLNVRIERHKIILYCGSNLIIRTIIRIWAKSHPRVKIASILNQ